MSLRIIPFGAFEGFSDQPRPGTSYYTQAFTKSLLGTATQYSIQNKRDSVTVSGMGIPKNFADANGIKYAQDDAGHILKETTPGAYDFAIVRSPGGNGAGLMGDQFKNLLYAQNSALGLYDGVTWTDSFQSLTAGQHPMDTFEDLRVIGNVSTVAVLFSDNTWNASAFTLPSGMSIAAIRSGPNGILIGANFGYQGALILWDGNSIRSKTSWKWTNGQILSIDRDGENWIVKTQRETLVTNGYTIRQYFGVFDDPLSFNNFDNFNNLPQQVKVVNDIIIFANPVHANGPLIYEYGKMKPGFYLYHKSTHTFDYIPVATGNTINVIAAAVFADINFSNRIILGYRDVTTGVNYIAALTNLPPTRATYISETIGIGRPHFQRTYFGPTEKAAQAVVLNLGLLSSITDAATITFDVSLKIYNFKRQLWGAQATNASLSNHARLQIDGTAGLAKAQAGDEVTILDGVNAGQVAHIIAIASPGTNTETWTLDTALTGQTENNIHLNVQPWSLVEKKTFTSLSQLKNIYFDIRNAPRGKQFLAKILIENIGSNLQFELQTNYFVLDDLGYDQST